MATSLLDRSPAPLPATQLGLQGFQPEAAYTLPHLPVLRLRCSLEAEEEVRLPPFHGSMLRGAFGHALRGTSAYRPLFEPPLEGEPPPFLKGIRTAPRPYVLEPQSSARHLAAGERLDFDLLLIGRAVEFQAEALLAVSRMAASGLAAGRRRFGLVRVEAPVSRVTLFEAGAWQSLDPVAPAVATSELPDPQVVELAFETPVRFTRQGEPVAAFTFRKLVFRMLRRVLELAHCHVPGADPDWYFRPLLDKASEVTARPRLRFVDGERYSSRQGRSMHMGGWIGTVRLEGDLAPFAPLLRAAELVHVGKGATFGLGQIRLVQARPTNPSAPLSGGVGGSP